MQSPAKSDQRNVLSRTVGCADSLRQISLDLRKFELVPSAKPTVVEHPILERLKLCQDSFILDRTLYGSRTAWLTFDQFPASMRLLDISKVKVVGAMALTKLIQSLCEANSKAVLLVRKKSVHDRSLHHADGVDFIQRYYDSEREGGRMDFKVERTMTRIVSSSVALRTRCR